MAPATIIATYYRHLSVSQGDDSRSLLWEAICTTGQLAVRAETTGVQCRISRGYKVGQATVVVDPPAALCYTMSANLGRGVAQFG